jgi:hypothetical protein
MLFFTDEALDGDDDAWSATQRAYAGHIESLRATLPSEVLRLALDPDVSLADGYIRVFEANAASRFVRLVVVRGITQMTLRFKGGEVVPPNLYLLACAIGAEYHAGRHFGRVLSTIREQELDLHTDRRLLLRLRLHPFHTFGIAFQDLEPIELEQHNERVSTPGIYIDSHQVRVGSESP